MEDDEETSAVPEPDGDNTTINLHPTNAYEFGQALNAAHSSGNVAACAELLASTNPEALPQYLSTQLDAHKLSFIMRALDSHLLEKNPNQVYKHLNHLHTADRFSVRELTSPSKTHKKPSISKKIFHMLSTTSNK